MTPLEEINFRDRSERTNKVDPTNFNSMIADCLGCKWTILLMKHIEHGINRPGKLVKLTDGLTTKVLNQCLSRMIKYKILEKKSFPQTPPKVEYYLTPFGTDLLQLLKKIELLQSKYFGD